MGKPIKVWVVALLLLCGCKTAQKAVIEVPIIYKERIVERLVPVRVSDDSLSMSALFTCDSLNQVVLRQLSEEKTKGVKSQFDFSNGLLNYHVVAVHDTVFIAAKDSFIYKEVPIDVNVPVVVNKLTKWQIIQIKAGKALFWILGIGGVYFLGFKTSLIGKLLKWLKSLF